MTREEEIRRAAEAYDTNNERYQYIFTEGAEWADSHRWHKASEELPKETCKVLTCEDNGRNEAIFLRVAMYVIEDNGEGHFIECHYCDKIEPDYWMEIPELPKED